VASIVQKNGYNRLTIAGKPGNAGILGAGYKGIGWPSDGIALKYQEFAQWAASGAGHSNFEIICQPARGLQHLQAGPDRMPHRYHHPDILRKLPMVRTGLSDLSLESVPGSHRYASAAKFAP
jgi:hypothetical protein